MLEPNVYPGPAPQDVLERHPAQVCIDAFIYPDAKPGENGVCLMMGRIYQSSNISWAEIPEPIARYSNADEAKQAVLQFARKHEVPNVYLRVK